MNVSYALCFIIIFRCSSFKGSTGRLCWLESSFVGNKRPSLTRDTPPFDTNTSPSHRKATTVRQTQNNGSWVNGECEYT